MRTYEAIRLVSARRAVPKLCSIGDDDLRRLLVPDPKSDEQSTLMLTSVIVGLLVETGMRLWELATLPRSNLDLDKCQILVDGRRTAPLKKNARIVPISRSLADRYSLAMEGVELEQALAIPTVNGRVPDPRMLHKILVHAQLCAGLTVRQCGIEHGTPGWPAFTARDLRRTAIETWANCGLDWNLVKLLAGMTIEWSEWRACHGNIKLSARHLRLIQDRLEVRFQRTDAKKTAAQRPS